jgi:hypothetical protein
MPRFFPILGLLALLGAGCGTRKEDFIAGRVRDACNQTWPVCGTTAGCYIGEESYLEGTFPGQQRFVIHLDQPSTVKLRVYLDSVSSAGEQTRIDFFEAGCGSRVQQVSTVTDFADESQRLGEYDRSADLDQLGDHLIQITSDAQANYSAEIVVTPKTPTE